MKRRALTLFEVVIALPLLAFFLTHLLFFFSQNLKMKHRYDQEEYTALNRHYFKRRLGHMLLHAKDPQLLKEQDLQQEQCEFYFNNGFSQNPLACGTLKAKLFFKDSALHLWLYNVQQPKEPIRKEILLSGLQEARFHYFYEIRADQKGKHPSSCKYMIVDNLQHAKPKNWVFLTLQLAFDGNSPPKEYHFSLRRKHWKDL